MEEQHISLAEAAKRLDISERTARRWIKSGKLRAYKPGRDYWILESAIKEVVEKSAVRPKVLFPQSREELLSNAGISSRWLLIPKDEFDSWWIGVNYEEASRRWGQIEAEYQVLEKAIKAANTRKANITSELKAELKRTFTETFRRRFAAALAAPSERESEEDFYMRQREGASRNPRRIELQAHPEVRDARAG